MVCHAGSSPAIGELLRYLTIPQFGLERAALEDVEVRGRQIKKGDVVIPALMAANRDPERFEDPNTFDIGRSATAHLAFGSGVHQCVGQQLARVEMRTNSLAYGVDVLPVDWMRWRAGRL